MAVSRSFPSAPPDPRGSDWVARWTQAPAGNAARPEAVARQPEAAPARAVLSRTYAAYSPGSAAARQQGGGRTGATRPAGAQRARPHPDDRADREEHGGGRYSGALRRVRGPASGQPPCPGRADRHSARGQAREHPARRAVRAGANRVDQRDRPAQVASPVHQAPGPQADPYPEQAGDQHREQQVERHRAQAQPDPAVRRGERDHGGDHADRGVRVSDGGHHVQPGEGHGEQRHVPVQRDRDEPGPGRPGEPDRREDAEHHAGREQDQRGQPGGTGGVPQRARGGGDRGGWHDASGPAACDLAAAAGGRDAGRGRRPGGGGARLP